ncbi:MAG: J domain-containing protein [Bdellovibrionales bacterium]|nr:J domain-containing protein [Bdellovibrionales bacterium]
MQFKDYYKILGVSASIDKDGIKKAYRKLAVQYHPDKNPDDPTAEEKFREVTEAYQVLSNEVERKKYDLFSDTLKHSNINKSSSSEPKNNQTDPNFEWNSSVSSNFNAREIFNDVFGDIFSSAKEKAKNFATPRANDLRYDLKISLEEALAGCSKKIKFMRRNGSQNEPVSLAVNIPSGVKPGQRLKLRGEGDRDGGHKQGDLYVVIQYIPHPLFDIENQNLILEVPITLIDAILGREIEILTLTGTAKVTLPPGVTSGQILRLKGKGLKPIKAKESGDLLVKVVIDTPKNLASKDLDKLKDLQSVLSNSTRILNYNRTLKKLREERE